MALTIAVDIGGTFTDLLGYDARTGRLVGAKRPTTPVDLAGGVGQCLDAAGVQANEIVTFVHGSTVAINTVIERTGARTALVVTRGTRDVYAIGRGNRPDAYDIAFRRPRPLVPRHLTFEIDERLDATGQVLTPFDDRQAAEVAAQVAASGVDAVAVCFLHAWCNQAHEARMGTLLREALPSAFVTLSHEILREYGEYERTSTTVLNACVGPRIGAYLDGLARGLRARGFGGELLIMQSNGGVMAPSTARALPVATLESGPVGGFIAAARVGARLGHRHAIAFDMGGTTAKANLVRDGRPQMARGYHIGGYAEGQPMTLPVVDTVEVGAGGGSIATFDALGGLRVGPESAGAEPGPACYGKGGSEPTVTDANVVLGRIDPRAFLGGEMRLDAGAALAAVEHVATAMGVQAPQAALAIVQVAVLKMSLAVRQVSVERGYDPRDFAMVAFGGAGPLHAVEVARALHIPVVVVPVHPAQFSAAGMLVADLRHDFVRTFYRSLDRADPGEISAIATDLEAAARRRLSDERSADRSPALAFSLDVRYAGQDFSMPVAFEPSRLARDGRESVRRAFDDQHQRTFGYHEASHPLEVVAVRLTATATGHAGRWHDQWTPTIASGADTPASRRVWLDPGDAVECPVYRRDALSPGTTLDGPALVQEFASTTLIFPGDRLTVAPSGELVIVLAAEVASSRPDAGAEAPALPTEGETVPNAGVRSAGTSVPARAGASRSRRAAQPSGPTPSEGLRPAGDSRPAIDIVTLEVVRHVLPAIANEMSHVLQRTSRNMMIYEVRDYCCGLLDVDGRLLSQNTGGVSHFVADMGVVIRDGMARYGAGGFHPGDVVITNHQRVAGQHLNNVMVYAPCFSGGELVGFAATRAHWVDVGGLSTGFSASNATDPWMEGLQLDQIKLWEQGEIDQTVWRLIADNIRYPESSLGDLKSQVAACRLAESRLAEIVERYGRTTFDACVARVFDQSEARCRAEVARLPDGTYEAESLFGGSALDANQPVLIKVKVIVEGGQMTIDLTSCSTERRQPINARTLAAPLIAYKAITAPRDPVNEGAFRGLTVKIQEGNYMMARYPAPMASWGRTLPSVVDTILSALAPVLSDRIPAAHLGVLGGTVVFFGVNAEGERFVTQSIEGGGWGGRPFEDGESASVSVCQGDVHNAPIEKMELRWPVLVTRRALRRDSGGPGTFRGGLGLEVAVRGLVEGSWTLADTGRHQYPPWGVNRGLPGLPSDSLMRKPGEGSFSRVDVIRHLVPAGTETIVVTAGGGGWGDPLERDPERVRRDVIDDLVSVEAARNRYGVVFAAGSNEVDGPATGRRRAELRAMRDKGLA
jgi:N-methylhydantoinase A/oxoprolinase/acetone carboxylase beta subunit/N-methylhydantoinase B/oxoprolinase/acetone carboxylase alpha subunit